VITNAYVIKAIRQKGFKRCYITFPNDRDKKQYETEGFLDVLPTRDLALVRFNPAGRKCVALKLAEKPPSPGESVFTFGSPLGVDNTPAFGQVTSVRTGQEVADIMTEIGAKNTYKDGMGYALEAVWIQHNADMSPGNSGGPLLNMRGEVLGLNTWTLPQGQHLNFATAAGNIKPFLASASKDVKPWSKLPKWRGAGDDSEGRAMGDAAKTLAMWKQFGAARYKIKDKVAALDQRLAKITPIDRRNPLRGLNARIKKTADCYRDFSTAYGDFAAQLKAIDTKMVDVAVIQMIVVNTDIAQRMCTACRELSSGLSTGNELDQGVGEIKLFRFRQVDEEVQSRFDIVRVMLRHKYNREFPTVEDIKKEDAEDKGGKKNADADEDRPSEKTADEGFRTWSDKSGMHQTRAKYVGKEDGYVKLEKADGKIVHVPLDKLSDADQNFVKKTSGDSEE
jgi:hypothetical protein